MTDWRRMMQRELLLLVGIFRQPAAAINALRSESRWLVPLLVLIVVTFMNSRMTQDIATREFGDLLQRVMTVTGENGEVAGDLANLDSESAAPEPISQFLMLGVIVLLGRWLLALLLRFVGRLFLRREIPFRQLFTLSVYLGYVHALGILLRLPLQLMSGSVRTTIGPSLLLRDPSGFVQYFFAQLDVFYLWEMGLAGLGLGLLLETDDHLRPAVIMIGLYLLWNMLAALSSSAIIG
jgi:hypothetical protein